jgi:hypothetical protein
MWIGYEGDPKVGTVDDCDGVLLTHCVIPRNVSYCLVWVTSRGMSRDGRRCTEVR